MGAGASERWEGLYYDGRTAERQAVVITLEPEGILIRPPDREPVVWPIAAVRQAQGSFSSEQIRLEFGADPTEALIVEQPGFIEALGRAYPAQRHAVRGRRSTLALLGWGMAGLATIAVAYLFGSDAAANWVANRAPASWETAMGQSVMDRMAPPESRCADSAALAHVNSIMERLISGRNQPYEFHVAILRDTTVNAFAAPGGFIAINAGLLKEAESPEEFAGVLAHELQHVLLRHSTRAIVREIPLRLAIASLGDGAAHTAASVAGSLGALRYRRRDEAEADREGVRMLAAARVDPAGAVSFMQKLESRQGNAPRLVSYLSSHPHTADRVTALEALASQAGGAREPLLDSANWARVRAACDTPISRGSQRN